MWIRKFVATSLLAIAATGLASATAHGETAVAAPVFSGPTMTGTEKGITYTTGAAADGVGIAAQVVGAHFDVAADGSKVDVTAEDGTVVESLPTVVATTEKIVRLSADVSEDGTTITMRPTSVEPVTSISTAKDIGLVGATAGMVIGFFAGAVAGCAIGLAGLVVGCVPMIFVGAMAGAVIGAVAGFVAL
ncbi:hypothetical protein VMT65_35455 [Nocardia sp. CDC153]|uniref:hypothetical protein n=1 Tax=Nocardia sp. CDC153 TaxID=3112167 RepID=UPI002DB98093|nr:hypothetical protein [Nocardia sp. CDC153]MEC3958376.1 hypothetical protein [Nocardia sp. CDC153]